MVATPFTRDSDLQNMNKISKLKNGNKKTA